MIRITKGRYQGIHDILPKIRRFFVVGWFWLGRKKQDWDGKLKMVKFSCETKEMYMFFCGNDVQGGMVFFLRVVIGPPMVQPRVTQSARPIPFWSNSEGIWIRNKYWNSNIPNSFKHFEQAVLLWQGHCISRSSRIGYRQTAVEGNSLFVALQQLLIFLSQLLGAFLGGAHTSKDGCYST